SSRGRTSSSAPRASSSSPTRAWSESDTREPQLSSGDDVLLDLIGAAIDRGSTRVQVVDRQLVRISSGRRHLLGTSVTTQEIDREVVELLVDEREEQLVGRVLWQALARMLQGTSDR